MATTELLVLILVFAVVVTGVPPEWTNNEEIEIFREYLRIQTVQPNVNYKPAIEFLKKQAASLNLPVSVYYPVDKENPFLVMTLKGSQPDLPSIILNSHMDVVPVFEEFWTHPPFAAEMDENGDIFARGAQDMKCVGMQYLAAIRALKRQGIDRFKRNIFLTFVPDEETGGSHGWGGFIKTDTFKEMNVGLALDEGNVAQEDGTIPVRINDKIKFQIEITFNGQSGHGSRLFDNTPGEKLNYVVGKLFAYRAEEKRKKEKLNYPEGNVTSINLTKLKGGVANNVIPAELSATFDIRVSVNDDVDEFAKMINRWGQEAGGNVTVKTLSRGLKQVPTRADDSNPYWVAFRNGVNEAGFKVNASIPTGGSTDMKYLRNLTIPALGFSPMLDTVSKAHDHDEYLNAGVYLKGIEIYKKVIPSIANV